MEVILKTKDLTKKYGDKVVVDNLNIEIKKGEIFGLLGPNGAGKSTTMNMICEVIKPTLGTIEFMGGDIRKNRKKLLSKLGYIPQELAIHGNLKAWENVELFTSLYGIKGEKLKNIVDESLDYVGLLDKRNEYAKNFSGGMKRRLNIACAIDDLPQHAGSQQHLVRTVHGFCRGPGYAAECDPRDQGSADRYEQIFRSQR